MDSYNLKIKSIIDRQGITMLKNPNIVGVGRGNKRINGYEIDKSSLVFYVRKKFLESSSPTYYKIPKIFSGIITDVVEFSGFKSDLRHRYIDYKGILPQDKPGKIGGALYLFRKAGDKGLIPVSNATLTIPVTKIYDQGVLEPVTVYALTNGSFLVTNGMFSDKDKVYYSEKYKKANTNNTWEIGTSDYAYKSGALLSKGKQIKIDAGLVKVGAFKNEQEKKKLLEDVILSQTTTGIRVTGTESLPTSLNGDNKYIYYSYGADTGKSWGKIRTLNTTLMAEQVNKKNIYVDQIVVENKSTNNDVGALATDNKNMAVAMLNGNFHLNDSGVEKECSFYVSINDVFKELEIQLL